MISRRMKSALVTLFAGSLPLAAAAADAPRSCPASVLEAPLGFALDSVEAAARAPSRPGSDIASRRDALLGRAEAALRAPLLSVTDKRSPGPSGDARDYLSLAPYWWPNPDSPDGLPYVRRDGVTNPERNGDGFDRVRLQTMTDRVLDLALAAYLSGDERFAAKAAAQIDHWFVDPSTAMNPNLRYAQSIPGRNDGRAIGIIDSRLFADVADAVAILSAMDAIPAETHQGFRDWIAAYAAWLIQSDFGQTERAAANNHGTFYDAQLAHFLVVADRCDLARRVLDDAKERAAAQIARNGAQPMEAKRTRSLHYHAFNAQAFLRLARIAELLGAPIYDAEEPRSGSIRDAVHYLARYAGDTDDWPYPRIADDSPEALTLVLLRARALDPTDRKVVRALRDAAPPRASSVDPILFFVRTPKE